MKSCGLPVLLYGIFQENRSSKWANKLRGTYDIPVILRTTTERFIPNHFFSDKIPRGVRCATSEEK